MGATVCAAVEGAHDLALAGRADPELGVALDEILGDCRRGRGLHAARTAPGNVRACVAAGVHAVVGTTGWDVEALADELGDGAPANVLVAPNFAIGAVLMMRFAAEASRHMARAEIVELHHDRKLDAPSGTAARTADADGGRRPDPLRAPAGPRRRPGGHPRRRRPDAHDPPRLD